MSSLVNSIETESQCPKHTLNRMRQQVLAYHTKPSTQTIDSLLHSWVVIILTSEFRIVDHLTLLIPIAKAFKCQLGIGICRYLGQ